MYVDPPAVREATRQLWAHLRDSLRSAGITNVPDALDEAASYDAAWLNADLLLAQTCGYPFVTRLRRQVRLVATPCYDYPGCDGAFSGSFIVVRADDPAKSMADLAGRRAAINDPSSNSGYNLLRATVAPHAHGRPFFSGVVETGGHSASLFTIAENVADVAAIDCVTWGNIRRHAPERLEGLRILCETPKTPGLPVITRAAASDAEVTALRIALDRAVSEPVMAGTFAALGIRSFATLTEADYDPVLQIERDAIALGYPIIV
jgi:ABC-type phosphate/phosphonate transport system substrate-binding protein